MEVTDVTRQASDKEGICPRSDRRAITNGDGDQDFYLNNFGRPTCCIETRGRTSRRHREAGVANGYHVGPGLAFSDIEGDGDLDIYVARYVNFTYENHRVARFNGYPAYWGPWITSHHGYALQKQRRWHLHGCQCRVGRGSRKGTGMGMVAATPTRMATRNLRRERRRRELLLGQRRKEFEEMASLPLGLRYGGTAQATMGSTARTRQ